MYLIDNICKFRIKIFYDAELITFTQKMKIISKAYLGVFLVRASLTEETFVFSAVIFPGFYVDDRFMSDLFRT